jgi:hypothetical protein
MSEFELKPLRCRDNRMRLSEKTVLVPPICPCKKSETGDVSRKFEKHRPRSEGAASPTAWETRALLKTSGDHGVGVESDQS